MSDALFVWATVYRMAFTVLGGVVTAHFAPRKPMAQVLVLGAVGIVAALAGLLATWNQGLGPRWYPILLRDHRAAVRLGRWNARQRARQEDGDVMIPTGPNAGSY